MRGPLIEVGTVVELDRVRLPGVEGLIEDEKAEPVAGIKEGGRRWVVRGAHGIVAGRLEQLGFAFFRPIECGSCEQSVIVVDAAACEFY